MNANSENTGQDYDEDLPDFSTPEWEEKWKNASFSPSEPIDLDSVRVTNLRNGTTVVSYDMLSHKGRGDESRSIRPTHTNLPPHARGIASHKPLPPTANAFEKSPAPAKRDQTKKRSSG